MKTQPLASRPSEPGVRPSFGLRSSAFGFLLAPLLSLSALASSSDALFQTGVTAYRAADYTVAAQRSANPSPSNPPPARCRTSATPNGSNSRTGDAILAWEQALWLDPFNEFARQNLRFARKTAQLEAPELAWYRSHLHLAAR